MRFKEWLNEAALSGTDGWKIHLSASDPSYLKNIIQFLFAYKDQMGVYAKVGGREMINDKSGDPAEQDRMIQKLQTADATDPSKQFTIYVGSFDNMMRITQMLQPLVAKGMLNKRRTGEVKDQDLEVTPGINARFDVRNALVDRAGKHGIPAPAGQELMITKTTRPGSSDRPAVDQKGINFLLKNADVRLRREYGTAYTGSQMGLYKIPEIAKLIQEGGWNLKAVPQQVVQPQRPPTGTSQVQQRQSTWTRPTTVPAPPPPSI